MFPRELLGLFKGISTQALGGFTHKRGVMTSVKFTIACSCSPPPSSPAHPPHAGRPPLVYAVTGLPQAGRLPPRSRQTHEQTSPRWFNRCFQGGRSRG